MISTCTACLSPNSSHILLAYVFVPLDFMPLYKLYDEKQHSVPELCDMLGISKTTLYDYLKLRKNGENPA